MADHGMARAPLRLQCSVFISEVPQLVSISPVLSLGLGRQESPQESLPVSAGEFVSLRKKRPPR